MDWDKAKTLTIVFLLVLDAVLAALNLQESNRYIMSAQQTNAIIALLDQNGIHLKTAMPKSYRPMRQLSMSGYEYDETELIHMFFADPENVEPSNQLDKTVYTGGDQTLTLQNGYITFDCPSGTNELVLTDDTALAEAKRFLAGKTEFSSFVPDFIFMDTDGCRVQFCQKYQNYIIDTNFIEFLITEKGIVQIDCTYCKAMGFTGQPAEICAVDEAMLHFCQYYKDAYQDRPAEILQIDLVYYQKEGGAKSSGTFTAAPHYRIVVEGFERPFLINAYLNRIEQV